MTVSLSKAFPGLDPIRIRRIRAAEIFKLMKRYSDYCKRKNTADALAGSGVSAGPGVTVTQVGGRTIIRRPAGDNWF